VAELTSRCAVDGTRVLTGGCVPVGDGALPFAPIVEGLRALVGDPVPAPSHGCYSNHSPWK
jgi:hypothetical protein